MARHQMNLYEYVRSNPAQHIDPFGLDATTIDAGSPGDEAYMRPLALGRLNSYQSSYGGYRFWSVTGLNGAITRMRSAAWQIGYQDPAKRNWATMVLKFHGAIAAYDPWLNTMYFYPNVGAGTIFHEFVHVLQDLGPGMKGKARDEGEAWAAELQLGGLWQLKMFEDELKGNGNCRRMKNLWRIAWSKGTGFPSILGFNTGEGVVNAVDVRGVASLTGFGARCNPLANAYNRTLRSRGLDKAPCCLKLKCTPSAGGGAVGPDHVLNPVWR